MDINFNKNTLQEKAEADSRLSIPLGTTTRKETATHLFGEIIYLGQHFLKQRKQFLETPELQERQPFKGKK